MTAQQKLEASGYLENYLWKHFGPTSSYDHVHSIVLLINEKFRGGMWSLESVCDDAEKFAVFFDSYASHYVPSLDIRHKQDMATFALNIYKSLDNVTIRQNALQYVSLQMWSTLPEERLASWHLPQPQQRS